MNGIIDLSCWLQKKLNSPLVDLGNYNLTLARIRKILGRCHHSQAAVTLVEYGCDLQWISSVSKILKNWMKYWYVEIDAQLWIYTGSGSGLVHDGIKELSKSM